MNSRWFNQFAAALALALAPAGAAAQGVPDQGEGYVDGEFLKPAASRFLSTTVWQYRFTAPGAGWQTSGGGAGWAQSTSAGFNGGGTMPGDIASFQHWPAGSSTLWALSTFTPTQDDLDELMFWGRWDDDIAVYVNGVLAVEREDWTPSNRFLGLSEAARASLVPGAPNALAVRVVDRGGGRHLNLQPVRASELVQLPVWGTIKNDEVLPIVELVRERMSAYGVPAGAVSVFEADGLDANNHRELVDVGIGYMDKQFQRQVSPDTQFRLASLDKHPVRAAIEELVASGTLHWDDNVWDLLEANGVSAIGSSPDPLAASYTLLDIYESNATLVGFPWDDDFFDALGVTPDTITDADLMSWMFSNPTDGESCYNPCSDVLNYLVDAVAPGGLEAYFSSDWGTEFVFAGGKVENRTYDAEGQLLQPWYVTLSNSDEADYQFDAIRVLASTARDNSLFWIQNNTPENYHLVWYGGFSGTQTFMRTFRSADDTRHLYVTALFNMVGMPFGDAPHIDGALQELVANLPSSAYSVDDPTSWSPSTTHPDGALCFVDDDCANGVCDAGVCGDGAPEQAPCDDPITLSPNTWTSGNFGTTEGVCYRIDRSINGMGVSSMNGRTLRVNGVNMAAQCPAQNGTCTMPLPATIDGYYYFEATAGAFPWATIYWW